MISLTLQGSELRYNNTPILIAIIPEKKPCYDGFSAPCYLRRFARNQAALCRKLERILRNNLSYAGYAALYGAMRRQMMRLEEIRTESNEE